MIERPMDVLQLFPIRKTKKQKQAFRDAAVAYAENLGYPVTIEKDGFSVQNVVIGDPKTAKYLLTAHYDTPAALLIPNLLTPCNPVTFFLYQLLVVLLFMVAAIVPGVFIGVLLMNPELGSFIGVAIYWAMLLMMLFGPANKHNANDNTSGVVTLLETMKALPPEQRSNVCFILFDLEEGGLLGSAAYVKAHKKEIKNQIILNCDCCGDGDELMLFPTPKLKRDSAKMELMAHLEAVGGTKSLKLHRKGFSVYPSDQRRFPYGVGIAAFRRSRWAGLYCSRIHTRKDTVLEEENVIFLRDRFMHLIGSAVQEERKYEHETL